MSEDSIALESSLSCRTEVGASLPPRKRLLAGFKQNDWSSPSSSSCVGPMEEMQVKANFEEGAMAKLEEHNDNSVDVGERGAVRAPNCAEEESMDSGIRRQRKSKRRRASFPVITKKKRKINAEVKAVPAKKDLHAKAFAIAETEKDAGVLDAVTVKVFFEAEEVAIAPAETDATAVVKANEEEDAVACAGALKLRRNPRSKAKEDKAACNEALKPRRNPGSKAKEEDDTMAACDEALTPRRNPSRQHISRNKDVEHKKQEAQDDRCSQIPPPLSDEELARQLHRAMNSSPRISRCLSHKEDGPVLS